MTFDRPSPNDDDARAAASRDAPGVDAPGVDTPLRVRSAVDERDQRAAARDARAARDDIDAESRDRENERLDDIEVPGGESWRTRSRDARRAAALDRERALADRMAARADRVAAATDRRRSATDELTGAYLRNAGIVELEHDFETARLTGQSMVVCFLDVDGLKAINDSQGHTEGDRILRRVADTVRAHLRVEDVLVRFGGDEFVFAVVGVAEHNVLDRIEAIDAALRLEEGVSVTCGTALASRSTTVAAAVERADHDLYRRRHAARATTTVGTRSFSSKRRPALDGPTPTDVAVDAVLAEPQSVQPVYQPIVDLKTRGVIGYEALARWPHLPAVDPAAVFATAAARGALLDVDWASRLAAIEGALAAGLTSETTLFLNIEPHSLDNVPAYAHALVRAATEKLSVVVELTERSLLADPGALLRQVDRARAEGCAIALDDVGANPDSLTLLEFISPDIIKLDHTLVQQDPTPDQARILASVRAHVEATGAVLLAEGIENVEHLDRAHAYGCTLGQGYLFGRPSALPATASDALTPPVWSESRRRSATARSDVPVLSVPSVAFDHSPPAVGRKPLVLALTRQIEDQAMASPEPLTILASFQSATHFGPVIARRYRTMAEANPFVAALGVGMSEVPAPGVRGANLLPTEAFAREWTITVVGHHYFAALIARDVGDTGDDDDRRFEFLHTYDRRTVVAAARSMMRRMLPGYTIEADVGAPATAPPLHVVRP